MKQANLDEIVEAVLQLTIEAGNAIMQIYDTTASNDALVKNKSDASPLTLADLAAHQCISEGLQRLTPTIPVVSEEDEASLQYRTPLGTYWLVDPLDGTKEFLARNGEFTVNVALVTDGEPIWGVVHAPAIKQTYWGGRGLGAMKREGNQTVCIHVAEPIKQGTPYRVIASKSHLNAETAAFISQLGEVNLIQAGSSLKICRIAQGDADIYPRLAPTCEWDTAAAQSVLEGANGYLCDIHKNRLRYGKTDIINPSFIASSMKPNEIHPFNENPF